MKRFLSALLLSTALCGSATAEPGDVLTNYLDGSTYVRVSPTNPMPVTAPSTVSAINAAKLTPPLAVNAAPSTSSSVGIVPAVVGSASSSAVLKASAGNLYGAYATVTAPSWLMVFNATSAPSNGATTAGVASGNMQDCVQISAGSGMINYSPGPPEVFSVGITAVLSSTACGTLTLANTGFIHGSAQ